MAEVTSATEVTSDANAYPVGLAFDATQVGLMDTPGRWISALITEGR